MKMGPIEFTREKQKKEYEKKILGPTPYNKKEKEYKRDYKGLGKRFLKQIPTIITMIIIKWIPSCPS